MAGLDVAPERAFFVVPDSNLVYQFYFFERDWLVSCNSMTREFFTPERKRWIAPSIHFASASMLRLNSSCLAGSRYQ
jgi:hypothetical protein